MDKELKDVNKEELIELKNNMEMSQRIMREYIKEVQALTHRLMLANTRIELLEEQLRMSVPLEEVTEENREQFLNDLEG